MIYRLGIICWLIVLGFSGYAQIASLSMSLISRKFQDFAYHEVIELSDQLLTSNTIKDSTDLLELRRMRAIAFYAQADAQAALTECLEILRLDPDYVFDPIKNSPKVISFFEEVKRNMPVSETHVAATIQADTLAIAEFARRENTRSIRGNVLRSLVLPGWGSLHQGKKRRGFALSSLAILTTAASVYLWRQTDRRESVYLNETDRQLINSRYENYNKSYQQRNTVLALLGAVWVYGQLDLTLFIPQENRFSERKFNTSITPADESLAIRIHLRW